MKRARKSERVGRGDELTFRGNLGTTRHGFLRLTPAYSVHLVRELLLAPGPRGAVLDPFCGTGTTLLSCAELGIDCTTVDLNPFLVWFARAKVARYCTADLEEAAEIVATMARAARARSGKTVVPPIHRIDRWWDGPVVSALGRAHAACRPVETGRRSKARDVALVSFCRAVIESANVSFGHQSMSFRKRQESAAPGREEPAGARVANRLEEAFSAVRDAVKTPLPNAAGRVLRGDSRAIHDVVGDARFARVVTSPPYPNRMSYVRELRPYMYWLGYLTEKRDAGELDWSAIGGTWGAATSRLATWKPNPAVVVPFDGFGKIVGEICAREPVLGRYVERYFEDMTEHAKSLARVVSPGGRVQYVVGNSKFYDVMVPAQEIYASLFESVGFRGAKIQVLRKRTSKRELFEYLVEAEKPAPSRR